MKHNDDDDDDDDEQQMLRFKIKTISSINKALKL